MIYNKINIKKPRSKALLSPTSLTFSYFDFEILQQRTFPYFALF